MSKLSLSTPRAAEIFREMLQLRRTYAKDDHFFRMSEFWEALCHENDFVKIKKFRADEKPDYLLKVGVVEFDGRITLISDERLLERASKGCAFSNFKLAHEVAHLGLDHHAQGAVVKNFQLYADESGLANKPPS
ncbi:MAG: hypothetical protein AAFY25_12430, partial [Pseudomonadota bacterium]